jgi:uncharacterized repeat protein (TIGR02543 family)
MDKETMSSYGFILITVILVSVLLVMGTPIGNKVFDDVEGKIETLVFNTGVTDVASSGNYGTIVIHYKYENTADTFKTHKTSIRMGESYMIPLPEVEGYEAVDKDNNPISQKVYVTSQFKEVSVYYTPKTDEITYVLNGGVCDESVKLPLQYQYGTTTKIPNNINKDGYGFAGWYEDRGFGGNRIYSIGNKETGDKTFYAKYSLI